ncbi:MAG: exosome complex protein Rrp42 [Candidatus Nezhaarchaeota archaeon]|nr:exosome complex protein Rrp42 [Candidatus Nezhaarchaeota archaeon]MCX8141931.1 exosome complex protein Rrp42 [Candidatus Nezhaarchaeota archaeon]MDW8050288.1 exosome complex protein Rrp42 [Nitrososphaerota archaeon]
MISKVRRQQIIETLYSGLRLDGRRLEDFRSIEIKCGAIANADGSAEVRIGKTLVIAGVKTSIGTPFPDTPNMGILIINAEFLPIASPTFEPGPPDENAIEMARVIDRGLRRSEMIDLKQLCIVPGKAVWEIWVDIHALNHDGNLMDASALASVAALLTAKIPKAIVGESGEVKIDKSIRERLPIRCIPATVTVAKIGDKFVVDPCLDEEEIADAFVTSTFIGDKLCAVQKRGEKGLTVEEMLKSLQIAQRKAQELIMIVKEAVNLGKNQEGWYGR